MPSPARVRTTCHLARQAKPPPEKTTLLSRDRSTAGRCWLMNMRRDVKKLLEGVMHTCFDEFPALCNVFSWCGLRAKRCPSASKTPAKQVPSAPKICPSAQMSATPVLQIPIKVPTERCPKFPLYNIKKGAPLQKTHIFMVGPTSRTLQGLCDCYQFQAPRL